MPPAVIVLVLVALALPALAHALWGRPRGLLVAWIAAGIATAVAQSLGELTGWHTGMLGDAQLLPAILGAGLAVAFTIALEGGTKGV